MVYCVYADPNGRVFDWDWVPEEQSRPGYPEGYLRRFANQISEQTEGVLLVPEDLAPAPFRRAKAWHSQWGDCMFFYASDKPAYANRVTDDLTEYRTLESRELVGCKVKNFSELLARVRNQASVRRRSVLVSAVLAASLVRQMADHQQWEKTLFFRFISDAALQMDNEQRVQLLQNLGRLESPPEEEYVNRICEIVPSLARDRLSTEYAAQVAKSRRAIEDSYVNLIAAAGSTRVEAAVHP
jgi:hypothetical protein